MKLEIGYNQPFEIRKEIHLSEHPGCFDILYLSDLHFNGFTGGMISTIISTVHNLNPAMILFGGDYIDTRKGLGYLNELLSSISHRKHVFAIGGNHDYYFGIRKVEKAFVNNNASWIEKQSIYVNIENTKIRIDGNMVVEQKQDADLSILLLHKPLPLVKFSSYYNIAFAGHLHGCQFVLWQSGNNLYPGKLFYPCNFLKSRQEKCNYFISKGAGDALPIRYNCRRDVVLVQVRKNNPSYIH
ncbi:MAG: metallophosphoesterase [Chitinophagaceae bacterium]|nr:metallophosphoesterase [Chitinophagaceae bacterium]